MHPQPCDAPRRRWKNATDDEISTAEYADWFNHRRIHGEIDNMPPAEYEALYWATRAQSEPHHPSRDRCQLNESPQTRGD